MNLSYAALAAIIFAGGTAVGLATGTQMLPDSGEDERRALVEIAASTEEQKFLSQFEELSSRQEQVVQRESELDARSEQLEKKLASLETLAEDQARMYDNLRVDRKALEDQKAELEKQEKMISAQQQSVLERESQLIALRQKLDVQSAAIRAQDLAETVVSKLDLDGDQLVSRAASTPALSGVELSAVALQEPVNSDKSIADDSQAEKIPEASANESVSTLPNNGPIAEVHFELNSAKLTPGALKRAREAVGRLQNTKFSKIRIAGHTDTTGSAGLNRTLSSQRAEAVADIFVQAGLSRQMIEIVSFGETYDKLPVSTEDGISEPLNRCVGIFVEEIAQSSLQ